MYSDVGVVFVSVVPSPHRALLSIDDLFAHIFGSLWDLQGEEIDVIQWHLICKVAEILHEPVDGN